MKKWIVRAMLSDKKWIFEEVKHEKCEKLDKQLFSHCQINMLNEFFFFLIILSDNIIKNR